MQRPPRDGMEGVVQTETGSPASREAALIRSTRSSRGRRTRRIYPTTAICALLASSIPSATAQSCISLANSQACSAFNTSSISTDSGLVGLFPFLSSVTDVSTFDSGLQTYIGNGFTQLRYQQLIGCSNVNLDNTTDFYARYTASVLCNAIVQNSITPCSLTGNAIRPLCADSCAEYAQDEQKIAASNICGTAGSYALTQIRADFTNCALPADSISGTCIAAVQNEPNNCGFSDNLTGLCSYCSASSPNATDSCCVFSGTETRCSGVVLPVIASASLQPVTVTQTGTANATGTPTAVAAAASHHDLSKGAIAGIAIGAILGALLLLALIIAACLLMKRRNDRSPATSVFNQPASGRQHQMHPQMSFASDGARDQERAGLAVMPGARVARMSALEGSSSSNERPPYTLGAYRKSTSDEEETPDSRLQPPPKRSGSLSSSSQLAVLGPNGLDTSPSTQADYTSPESQSEQLNFFKDYYSQDEIHQGDLVATLWAYEPRAADEFSLERGDMIKVIGIWDDGWATGVRVRQRADEWRPEGKVQRDSGMSNGSSSKPPGTADSDSEVKAFPLVCVCLPQHWRATIEGDSTEGSGPGRFPELP